MTNPDHILPGASLSPGSNIYTKTWFLTAGETDARGLMPVKLIAMRAIEVATDHSNVLGIGYANLATLNIGWVLVRLTIEVVRYPSINETYSMSTWIKDYNRFFSNRCHEMSDAKGNIIARVKTAWAAIDMTTRTMANLSELDKNLFALSDRECPIVSKPAPALGKKTFSDIHRFKFSDIDFNRHVNTISYLLVCIDRHTIDFYDSNSICRVDAAFEHECYFGEDIRVNTGADLRVSNAETTEMHRPDGQKLATIRLEFTPIHN